MTSGIIRKRMKIYGRVQGVGFRYRAEQAAGLLDVTGWVRNAEDGTVEMEVQGSEAAINKMMTFINGGTYVRIDRIETEIIGTEKESGFGVRW